MFYDHFEREKDLNNTFSLSSTVEVDDYDYIEEVESELYMCDIKKRKTSMGIQGRWSRGSRGDNCSPKYISGGAPLPQHLTGTILNIRTAKVYYLCLL